MLRRKRLNEVVATDTLFSDVTSVEGYTCSQVFFGCSSRIVEVYGMKSKSEFPDVYADFMREIGIPHTLRRDNALEEDSFKVRQMNRENIVMDEYTEPKYPQQNPADVNGVKMIKERSSQLMDRVIASRQT